MVSFDADSFFMQSLPRCKSFLEALSHRRGSRATCATQSLRMWAEGDDECDELRCRCGCGLVVRCDVTADRFACRPRRRTGVLQRRREDGRSEIQ